MHDLNSLSLNASSYFSINDSFERQVVPMSKSQCLFPLLSLQALKSRDCRRCVICKPMYHDARALARFIHAIAYEDTRRSIIAHDETQRARSYSAHNTGAVRKTDVSLAHVSLSGRLGAYACR